MSWIYTQNFNGLNTADLAGQDDWANTDGQKSLDVQETYKYEGAKAVHYFSADTDMVYDRAIANITDSGLVYIAMMRDGNTDGDISFLVRQAAVGERFEVMMQGNPTGGIIYLHTDEGNITLLDPYVASKWYIIAVEFNMSGTDQCRARINDGSGWSAWTDWKDMLNDGAIIDNIMLRGHQGSFNNYFDLITATNPLSFIPKAINY